MVYFLPLPVMELSDCTERISRSTLSSASGLEGCLQARQVPGTGSSDLFSTVALYHPSPISIPWMNRCPPTMVMSSEAMRFTWQGCWCVINQELLSRSHVACIYTHFSRINGRLGASDKPVVDWCMNWTDRLWWTELAATFSFRSLSRCLFLLHKAAGSIVEQRIIQKGY